MSTGEHLELEEVVGEAQAPVAGREREEFFDAVDRFQAEKKPALIQRYIVSVCLCDESGAALFTLDELASVDGKVVERLANEAQRVNGMGKHKDEPAKNS